MPTPLTAICSLRRGIVIGAIWPEADGFDDFFVGLVHYNLFHTPKCSIHELGGHILRGGGASMGPKMDEKYGCTGHMMEL